MSRSKAQRIIASTGDDVEGMDMELFRKKTGKEDIHYVFYDGAVLRYVEDAKYLEYFPAITDTSR